MVTKIYSIYDRVAEEFGNIFHSKNDQVAQRAYKELLKGVYDYQDYELYQIGSFDSSTGYVSENDEILKVDVFLAEEAKK